MKGSRRFSSTKRCWIRTSDQRLNLIACPRPGHPNTPPSGEAIEGGDVVDAEILLASAPLEPTRRRVLPFLLTPIDRQVEQAVAVVHRLDAADRRPVGLE